MLIISLNPAVVDTKPAYVFVVGSDQVKPISVVSSAILVYPRDLEQPGKTTTNIKLALLL